MTSTLQPREAHEGCYSICCSGYVRTEILSNLPEPDLKGAIHPLFAPEKFLSSNFDGFTAQGIEQVGQLCTKMLDHALPFFHTIFFDKVKKLRVPSYKGHDQFEFLDDLQVLNTEQKAKTRAMLKKLASVLEYRVSRSGDSSCGSHDTSTGPFNGRHIQISIAKTEYENVRNAHVRGEDVISRCVNDLLLSMAILHELAHAAMLVRKDMIDDDRIFFFPNTQLAEEGFELEDLILGGIIGRKDTPMHRERTSNGAGSLKGDFPSYRINNVDTKHPGMIILRSYPSMALYQSYEADGLDMGSRGSLPEYGMRWNVSLLDVHRLFSQATWDSLGPDATYGALHVRKTTGYRYSAYKIGKGSLAPFRHYEDRLGTRFFDLEEGVPAGYEADLKGLVQKTDQDDLAPTRVKGLMQNLKEDGEPDGPPVKMEWTPTRNRAIPLANLYPKDP